ncbi:creatininase family protein [Thioalkalivibrio nitratireducens]|nr:creatininase family protein [Thioalkalivibrio nitratireducens]
MTPTGFPLWQQMTSPEIAAAVTQDPVLILPLAAIEQHGPQLPLSTDLEIGLGLLDTAAVALGDDVAVWVLPPLAVGTSMEHDGFPGTLSLEPETALAVIEQYGAAVARSGVRRLLLCNSHGGNTQVMDLAALRLRRDHGLLVVKCSYFRLGHPDGIGLPATELQHGWHGGAIETAMMLHLAPDSVRAEGGPDTGSLGQRLEHEFALLGPEGRASFAWMARDLHVSGVVGDASLADTALGARLVAYYGDAIARVIRETRAFPLGALRPPVA